METSPHNINSLFDQLGLDSSDEAIDSFIRDKGPLDDRITLSDATFWNRSQSAFLKEGIQADSDWAEAVDELNVRLRS